ncbi:hypothetical protein Tco_1333474 [Tanacetum coccineum]
MPGASGPSPRDNALYRSKWLGWMFLCSGQDCSLAVLPNKSCYLYRGSMSDDNLADQLVLEGNYGRLAGWGVRTVAVRVGGMAVSRGSRGGFREDHQYTKRYKPWLLGGLEWRGDCEGGGGEREESMGSGFSGGYGGGDGSRSYRLVSGRGTTLMRGKLSGGGEGGWGGGWHSFMGVFCEFMVIDDR